MLSTLISIPSRLLETIHKDPALHGSVLTALQNLGPLLNRPCNFFPEFTNHGCDHINAVLTSCEEIITQEACRKLNPEDIYVLSLACCLHDFAMTFSWQDLVELINNAKYSGPLQGYKEETESWIDLWTNFEQEINNLGTMGLSKIIGENFPIDQLESFQLPKLTPHENVNVAQLKVAGEFVRKHHARISQTISQHGFPNANTPILEPSKQSLNEIAGFIARSHHESMRDAFDRIEDPYKKNWLDTRPVFLMAVLRIADLMQITAKRTPAILFNIGQFWSSVSALEWKKHLSILNFHTEGNDPSCLNFQVKPDIDSVGTLTAISNLFTYFQSELDKAWATLGEAYGNTPLAELQLKFRRIRSNLDSSAFIQKLSFEAEPGAFAVDLSLIEKLITPLYGNKPHVGLRELIQNALDATRQRGHEEEHSVQRKVIIELNSTPEGGVVVIRDDGCGMDGKVIRNHFLRIGSSYRSSNEWKRLFSVSGKAQVLKSGRFGIGLLAGFILGPQMEVTTRKAKKAPYALKFQLSLESKLIQIDKDWKSVPDGGTTIRIAVSEKQKQILTQDPSAWTWYLALDQHEEVEIYIDGQKLTPPERAYSRSKLKPIHFETAKFDDFHWANIESPSIPPNVLYVNSLRISSHANQGTNYPTTLDSYDESEKYWPYDMRWPGVSLRDPNADLPLNLARDGFSDNTLAFGPALYDAVITEYLTTAQSLSDRTFSIDNPQQLNRIFFLSNNRNKAATDLLNAAVVGFFGFHKYGALFSDLDILRAADIQRIIIFGSATSDLIGGDTISLLDEKTAAYKIQSLGRMTDTYNRSGIERCVESQLINYLNNGNFLRHIFGTTARWSNQPEFELAISKNRESLIENALRIKPPIQKITSEKNVIYSSSEQSFLKDHPLLHKIPEDDKIDFIACIGMATATKNEAQSALVRRWLKEFKLNFI